MIIPAEALSPDTLNALIEEFVTRDGTDYGDHETDLATKVSQVKALLARKEVVIIFNEATEQAGIVHKDQINQL
ncbi:YheU family protein [Neptunomonas phycophila]|uniref:YheU family protein n=1 Tax=Neptunomonas phycophila TaxID=1572645 RepID=A0AAW7XMT7_9GAMM|nr:MULTISPECIES: YheU family protein [Neptunomonas]MBT3144327.1 YheU family protein [Neptunomonas phycophila]MDN2661275.1 YheU family protein [Neptunomonas sp. CHC150]MDO6455360.1 YheU family protein [Neptunomonas phycophila]MDO6467081.1 YheU family protein [Neptunomonas phycophila]MDO6782491.1 YheU family protein [Neptunomonas phycophila]